MSSNHIILRFAACAALLLAIVSVAAAPSPKQLKKTVDLKEAL